MLLLHALGSNSTSQACSEYSAVSGQKIHSENLARPGVAAVDGGGDDECADLCRCRGLPGDKWRAASFTCDCCQPWPPPATAVVLQKVPSEGS